MTRSRWTPEELRGYSLAWLVDLTFAGQTLRAATHALDFGEEHYPASLGAVTHSRSLDLFDKAPQPESMVIEGYFGVNVAEACSRGHRMEGCVVQVSQVRVNRLGVVVDAYDNRRVVLTGITSDAQWGRVEGDGATFVRFSATRRWFASMATIPRQEQRVNRSTWPFTGELGDADIGVSYPVIIGYPGRDDYGSEGVIPAMRGAWLRKRNLVHLLCLSVGKVEATTVRVMTDEDPVGWTVNTSYERWSSPATVPAFDNAGNLLCVVDYFTELYDDGQANDLGESFHRNPDEASDVFVSWPSGSGGMLWNGEVLRKAGDVLEWALVQSGVPFDAGRLSAVKPFLDWCMIDFALCEPCNAMDFVQTELLPLLPVSLSTGELGVYPVVWRSDAAQSDAVAAINADVDAEIEVGEYVTEDASNVVNSIAVQYAWGAMGERYRYTVRVGPEYADSTDYAQGQIRSDRDAISPFFGAVDIFAVAAGLDGAGIRIDVVAGGAEAVTDFASDRYVLVNFVSGVSTAATLAASINGSSSLVRAEASGATSAIWGSTTTAQVFLRVTDFGTLPSELCARSRERLAPGDAPGPDAGLRTEEIATPLVYDQTTAVRIAEWKAAAYAMPHRRVSFLAPEQGYAHLDLGDIVTFTDSALGFDDDLATVEGVDHYSDTGTVGVRLVFVDR